MKIDLPAGYYLDGIRDGDQGAYIEHFREKELSDRMMLIPFPYTPADADEWVQLNVERQQDPAPPTEFAVRNPEGYLVGGIGLAVAPKPGQHRANLGYWIGRDYRRRGLGGNAIRVMTEYAFGQLGLRRIEAWVFTTNLESQRVVERAGFVLEGCVHGHHQKSGVLLKSNLYALLHPDELGGVSRVPRQAVVDSL